MNLIRFLPAVVLLAMLPLNTQAATLKNIYVHENLFLSKESILRLSRLDVGAPVDSLKLDEAYRSLMLSGCFDTVMVQQAEIGDTAVTVHIFVRERKRNSFSFYGGLLTLNMYGEDKFWFSVTPGYERRYLEGSPQSLLFTVTFPYSYGVSAAWSAPSFPARGYNAGASISGRAYPNQYSAYYTNAASGSLFGERLFTSRLSARVSGAFELSKTWRVDTDKWSDLDWQILVTDPGRIEDRAWTAYPQVERVPSLALSLSYDRRNNGLYPTRGYSLFAEARRFWISNPDEAYHFNFNQATAAARLYLNPFRGQVAAGLIKFIVRDRFDPVNLAHRMIFYDGGIHFRGFTSLAGENLAYMDWEYRVRLFEMDFSDGLEGLNLSRQMQKLIKKMNYSADAFIFLDNGVFFGSVFPGNPDFIPFSSLSLERDLFTSFGLGGRLVYPGLGYVATAGIALYQRKSGLDEAYKAALFGTLSVPF